MGKLKFKNFERIRPDKNYTAFELSDLLGITRSAFDYNFRRELTPVKINRKNYFNGGQFISTAISFMKRKTLKQLAKDAGMIVGQFGLSDVKFKRKWNLPREDVRKYYDPSTARFDEDFVQSLNFVDLYNRV